MGAAAARRDDMKINLGCGSDYRPGWLNVDQFDKQSPDRVINIDSPPWPIESDTADYILLKHVLEHVGKDAGTFLAIVKELYRISKPDALIEIHVPHPRHNDFIGDPTHVRPIVPEMFNCFDLAEVERWQARGLPGTPLAIYLEVDFEAVDTQFFLDPVWQDKLARGEADLAAVAVAARSQSNVIQWTKSILRVRKPFKPGRSLEKLTGLRIVRSGGLGDVMMALAAASAIAELGGPPIAFQTSPQYRALAAACPFIAEVAATPEESAALDARFAAGGTLHSVNLDSALFGLSRIHEIDAFLRSGFGIHAPAALKGLRIEPPQPARERLALRLASMEPPAAGRARVLLHPSNGDRNRTWPQENWQALAARLFLQGHQVISIGQGAMFKLDGVVDMIDVFDPLEIIALMNSAELLVATDSGPIQLAGATDIGIVGIYSVVAGRNRLPYRNGELGWRAHAVSPACSFHPCYEGLLGSERYATYAAAPRTPAENAKYLGDWCLNDEPYACLSQEMTVERVLEACEALLAGGAVAAPARAVA
jgi:ADP-heptose:LPS heptosyltransferase